MGDTIPSLFDEMGALLEKTEASCIAIQSENDSLQDQVKSLEDQVTVKEVELKELRGIVGKLNQLEMQMKDLQKQADILKPKAEKFDAAQALFR